MTLGIHEERPRALVGERPFAQPLLGRPQQDHVLVFPHEGMGRTRNGDENFVARSEIGEQVSLRVFRGLGVKLASDDQRGYFDPLRSFRVPVLERYS